MDLRWGIRDESEDDHSIIDFCLREIDDCQKVSIGPTFVVCKTISTVNNNICLFILLLIINIIELS